MLRKKHPKEKLSLLICKHFRDNIPRAKHGMQDQLINSDQFENRAFAWFCSCLSIVIRKMFLDGLVVHLLFKTPNKTKPALETFHYSGTRTFEN